MPLHTDWSTWVETLRRFKMDGFASWFLEAGAPLKLLGAQALYISQPFVGGNQLEAIANMLEDEEETQAFVHYLRGENLQ
jgi:hypothetical protein